MYQVLDKDTIEKEIMPHLSLAKCEDLRQRVALWK
jgi:hypothetical protein